MVRWGLSVLVGLVLLVVVAWNVGSELAQQPTPVPTARVLPPRPSPTVPSTTTASELQGPSTQIIDRTNTIRESESDSDSDDAPAPRVTVMVPRQPTPSRTTPAPSPSTQAPLVPDVKVPDVPNPDLPLLP